ncbi:MAG: uroporphyrinogen decarboxylase family protein [Candidatus Cyclobacteriaceae bacterium M3_2C_046]
MSELNPKVMTTLEKVKATLNHQDPEGLVVDIGSTGVTGIHVLAIEKLRQYYGLPQQPIKVIEPYQMLGQVDEDLARVIGLDIAGVMGPANMLGVKLNGTWKTMQTFWGQEVLVPEDFNTSLDEEGNLLVYPEGDTEAPPSAKMPQKSYFFDAIVRQPPVEEDKLKVEDNLEEFKPVSEADLLYWQEATRAARASGKGVMASLGGTALGDIALVPAMQLKHPKGIRDIAEWYMSLLIRPDYVKSIFERQTEIALHNLARYWEFIGGNVDVVFLCGTDFGTQTSTFCSPEQFDEIWLPYYRQINDWIHTHTTWKTMKHSCGAVESFMPHFIEAGFDIINPVQVNAAGMDPVQLKKNYGKDLVFWGGGVDTQQVLPYAKPEEVKEEVKKLIEIFGQDGGFVFNTVHNIQANVPVENLVAMIETINNYK